MKKLIIRVLLGIVVLLILVVLAIGLFLDAGIKRGVETFGPRLTKVDVKLDSVSIGLLSGSGKIKGLVIGNPEGYKSPTAITVGAASLSLSPGSLLSDKVVIKSINLKAPEITFETDFHGNNLSKIRSNVNESMGATNAPAAQAKKPEQAQKAQAAQAGKKLEVDEFVITGAKLHVAVTALGGEAATVTLGDIHLKDLGTGPDGITAAELTSVVLKAIEDQAVQVAASVTGNLKNAAKNLGKSATNSLGNIGKSLGDLFKKK
jgi:uncharacterized protein involved in outer membrane biogenesis